MQGGLLSFAECAANCKALECTHFELDTSASYCQDHQFGCGAQVTPRGHCHIFQSNASLVETSCDQTSGRMLCFESRRGGTGGRHEGARLIKREFAGIDVGADARSSYPYRAVAAATSAAFFNRSKFRGGKWSRGSTWIWGKPSWSKNMKHTVSEYRPRHFNDLNVEEDEDPELKEFDEKPTASQAAI